MEWISVKDRLPEKHNALYLVSNEDGTTIAEYGPSMCMHEGWRSENGCKLKCPATFGVVAIVKLEDDSDDAKIKTYLHQTTHWMPLPEAPQEAKDTSIWEEYLKRIQVAMDQRVCVYSRKCVKGCPHE